MKPPATQTVARAIGCLVACAISLLVCHAPYVVVVRTSPGLVNAGFLLTQVAASGGNTVAIMNECDGKSVCDDYVRTSFAMYLLYLISAALAFAAAPCTVLYPAAAVFVLAVSFTLQAAACFGYSFHVIGALLLVFRNTRVPVTSWDFNWVAYVAIAGLSISFIWVFVLMFLETPVEAPCTPASKHVDILDVQQPHVESSDASEKCKSPDMEQSPAPKDPDAPSAAREATSADAAANLPLAPEVGVMEHLACGTTVTPRSHGDDPTTAQSPTL